MPPRKSRKNKTAKGKEVVENKLVKALSHPVRARALAILNSRVASPKEIADELDREVGNVGYHVRTLKELGCVELVSEVKRRGATEHFYRGITRSFLNDANWAQLTSDAKNGVSIAGLKTQNNAALKALEAGTFDARPDRHLSCSPLAVDELGWDELAELLAETLEEVWEIQDKSTTRQAELGTERIPATVSILFFESPDCPPPDTSADA
jgi:DNA-binding transcriptional ArsR family regulator